MSIRQVIICDICGEYILCHSLFDSHGTPILARNKSDVAAVLKEYGYIDLDDISAMLAGERRHRCVDCQAIHGKD